MAVFTAIATAVVTGITGATIVAGTWAAFAVSVIATGLAVVTARLIAPGARGGAGIQDQGVRVQLPPATENKIPVIYGRVFQQPIITDARISNENKTMTYVLTLSERTDSGTFTLGDVYWNDQKLQFQSDGYTVSGAQSPDGTTSTSLAGLVRVWAWAGGVDSSYQIKGPSPAVSALSVIPDSTSTYLMSNLVFAVVQLDYNSDKGVTGLPTMTFEINNSLKNPGDVLADYLLNNRYGVGLTAPDLDLDSITGSTATSLKSISAEIPPNQFNNDGSTSTQARYIINGILNTGETVKNNIDRINLASASWLTFDHKRGQWSAVVNRAATVAELAVAPRFTDDNIIGEITLTSTNLEDLFNSVEVQYANKNTRDQSDYFRAEIPQEQRNELEPDNRMQMRLDMVNNKIHAGRIGLIELKQSRFDLVISFTADYSALELEVGDIIKVTNTLYSFTDKLFRVTRVRETEGEDGTLAAEITALQYDASVYTDTQLSEAEDRPTLEIPPGGTSATLPAPSKPLVTASDPTNNAPNFTLQTQINSQTGPVSILEWFYSSSTSTGFTWLDNQIPPDGNWDANEIVTDVITNFVPAGTWYFRARTGVGGVFGPLSEASDAFSWNPQPAGASGGVINSSTQARLAYVAQTSTGILNVTLSTGTNQFVELRADTALTYQPSSRTMKIGPWTVSTVTDAIYGQFITTGTQSIATSTVVAAVSFNQSVYNDGITLSNGSRINVPETGIYYVNLSAVFENSSNQSQRALMWLRKNGVDEPDTNTVITVPARHGSTNGAAVLTVGFVNEHQANDYIELYWNAQDAAISLVTVPASTTAPVYPRTPAVLLSVFKVVGAP